ncbi:putative membrane protein [Leptospira wolbachii serovar Codice str. CDC]|uniref:Membrane protein n=1 Tax=Leptospira wolbachii serovar Codice str. CDC TaxID=1218599 RepID=R9A0J6_9LEPT|nr:membrane protein [Leptospira wolbachii]EOQ95524.1 putative membrane protein [Leptospira wolbachii serovar Codice str. CDC]
MKRIRPFALLLFFFTFYLWNTKVLFESDNLYGRFDWDMYSFHVEFLRKSFLEFGTIFPLWNPYYGAGFPVWENPTSKVGSFTHLLVLFFPTLTALKISFLFYFIFSGFLNFHSFRLYTKSNVLVSFLFVLVFQFSGFVFQKFYAGHLNQIPGLFLPALVFYILSFTKKQNWVVAISIVAITYILLSEGSIYPLSQTTFLIFFLVIREFYLSDKPREVTYRLAKLSILVLGILALKWIPTFLFVHSVGRYFAPDNYTLDWKDYYPIFFGSSQHPFLAQSLSQMQYRHWEYGNYLGQLPLFLSPLVFFTKRKMVSVLFLLTLVLWLMAGNTSPYSPATILEHLPIYSWERVYPRWSLSVVFLYAWCLAVGFQNLWNLVPKKFHIGLGLLTILCLLLHTQDTRKMNTKFLSEIFVLPLPEVSIQNQNHYPITVPSVPNYGSDSQMLPALLSNLATNDIYENITFYFTNQTIKDKDYKGEFYLLPTKQKFDPKTWKPDYYEFDFLKKGETLVFNQKFHQAFTTSVPDLEPCSFNGYLAVSANKEIRYLKIKYSLLKTLTPISKFQNSCKESG